MELGRINKKMILLCEKTNGLWQKMLAESNGESLEDCFANVLDVTAKRNAESWRKKENPRIQVDLKSWSERISIALGENRREDLFDDSVGSGEFSDLLGISPMARRYLFDVFYSDINKSSISCITFDQRKARNIASSFCGIYELTLSPDGLSDDFVGLMDIRYYMPVGLDARHSKQFKIRCKLDMPAGAESSRNLQRDVFEYDGYLSLSRDCFTFTMESRPDAWERRVLSVMVSANSSLDCFSGKYLKNPFEGNHYGMHGNVTMRMRERHPVVIEPHTNLCEV